MLYCLTMNKNGVKTDDFHTWSHAVQFPLQTYENDRELESAVDALKNIAICSNDKVNEYNIRLAATGRNFEGHILYTTWWEEFERDTTTFARIDALLQTEI